MTRPASRPVAVPAPLPQSRRRPESGLQAQKSAATRKALVEAAIRCVIRYGYASTTTPRVAAEAGLSRGAMLHHFENGPALIRATIAYLHEKRLRAFARSRAAPEMARGSLPVTLAITCSGRVCRTPPIGVGASCGR